MSPRIAFLDIENSPLIGAAWENYETDILWIIEDWYILSFSVLWLGGKHETYILPDFPLYKREPKNDKALLKKLWEVMDEADILIAHNGNGFDIKKAHTRFIIQGMPLPSPFQTVDTLTEARKIGKFTSNRLDAICETLGIGKKLPHTGIKLWRSCVEGYVKKDWETMRAYNAHDVSPLLTGLYDRLRPWMKTHPQMGILVGNKAVCPRCTHPKGQWRGKYKPDPRYTRWRCSGCTKWSKGIIKKGVVELK